MSSSSPQSEPPRSEPPRSEPPNADPLFEDREPSLPPVTPARWPLWLFILALLGGAGYLGWSMWRTTDPTAVLVAIELDGHWYEGSLPAAELADALNGGLESLGFSPVRPGDPEVLATLEGSGGDLAAAARSLGAGFVVTGRIDVETIEHPVGDGYFELRANGAVEVFHVDDESSARARSGDIRGWSGAPERERALRLLADGSLSRLALGEALPRLLEHPVLAELLEGDARTVSALNDASKFVGERHRALSTAEKAYEGYARRRQLYEKGPVKVTYHGSTAADDALCGVGAAGVCVKTESTRPYFSPHRRKLRMLEELETVEWRPADGEPSVLWAGYNVPGYPRVAPDGGSIAFVEDIFGWAKAPTLIVDGEAKRLLVDPGRYFTQAQPAPGAAAVAMFAQPDRRGPRSVLVLDAAGEMLLELPPSGGSYDALTWLDAENLVLVQTPPTASEDGAEDDDEAGDPGADAGADPAVKPFAETARQTVWKLPIDGSAPTALYIAKPGERLRWMRRSKDGRRLAFQRRYAVPTDEAGESPDAEPQPGPGLAILDLTADPATLTAHPLPRRVEAPTFSPDGRWLTFEYNPPGSRDEEIAVIDLNAPDPVASLQVLTDNPERDRYPVFGPKGERIYFEQLGEDPNNRRRGVSLIASVPAP